MTLLAQLPASPLPTWPDGFDAVMLALFLVLALGAPALGYYFMAIDFRRWLRSLRRALVVVTRALPVTPYWALRDRPPCLTALGLKLPCTEADVLAAYREQVKALHPDRGGDMQQFLCLQRYFEQAQHLVRQQRQSDVTRRRQR